MCTLFYVKRQLLATPTNNPWDVIHDNCLTPQLLHRTRVGPFMATLIHPSNTQRPLLWTLIVRTRHKPYSPHPKFLIHNPSQCLEKTSSPAWGSRFWIGLALLIVHWPLFMYIVFTLCVFFTLIAAPWSLSIEVYVGLVLFFFFFNPNLTLYCGMFNQSHPLFVPACNIF